MKTKKRINQKDTVVFTLKAIGTETEIHVQGNPEKIKALVAFCISENHDIRHIILEALMLVVKKHILEKNGIDIEKEMRNAEREAKAEARKQSKPKKERTIN